MCGDLFSSFDFYTGGVLGLGRALVFTLVIVISGIMLINGHFVGRFYVLDGLVNSVVRSLTRGVVLLVSGVSSLGSVLLILLRVINFAGLIPYVFRVRRHAAFTFSLGLVV